MILVVAGTALQAAAQVSAVGDQYVTATLVAKSRNAVPGQPLQLALRQQITSGWHTYWVNPGDAGLVTTVDWTLPPGFKADPIVWPTPVRFAYGPVIGYGYETEVLLPITIHVPASAQPGTDIVITANANWLACSDNCVPEEATLRLSLPVGTALEPDPRWADAFVSTAINTPAPSPFAVSATLSGDSIVVTVATGDATRLRDIEFFPSSADVIRNDASQAVVADSRGLTLTLQRDRSGPIPAAINGVLAYRDLSADQKNTISAISIAAPLRSASAPTTAFEFTVAIVLAIIGGLILNLMPCVLPILSIKVFGLVQHAHEGQAQARLHGLSYTAGVLSSFAIVSAALIGLRAAGTEIGWGFQLQSPLFVTSLIYVVFVVGLNLSGVFTVGAPSSGIGTRLAMQGGTAGSFFTGALATLVATPCTAPFMAAAMGYAITQPWYISFSVFQAVGLGLALPYLTFAFSPALQRWLPKPGVWMVRLKEFLAFPMYATAVWLVYVLSQQVDAHGIAAALSGLVLITFGVWLWEAMRSSPWRLVRVGVPAVSFVAAAMIALMTVDETASRSESSTSSQDARWQPYSQKRLDELRTEGRAVFVDFTAAWCITCKVNERVVLDNSAVRQALMDRNVAMLRADWTRQDAEITRVLAQHGRVGVPLYLFYPGSATRTDGNQPIVLPQILTTDTVLKAIGDG